MRIVQSFPIRSSLPSFGYSAIVAACTIVGNIFLIVPMAYSYACVPWLRPAVEFILMLPLVAFGTYFQKIGVAKAYESAALTILSFAITWTAMGLIQLLARVSPREEDR